MIRHTSSAICSGYDGRQVNICRLWSSISERRWLFTFLSTKGIFIIGVLWAKASNTCWTKIFSQRAYVVKGSSTLACIVDSFHTTHELTKCCERYRFRHTLSLAEDVPIQTQTMGHLLMGGVGVPGVASSEQKQKCIAGVLPQMPFSANAR